MSDREILDKYIDLDKPCLMEEENVCLWFIYISKRENIGVFLICYQWVLLLWS